jgi:tetratricopeptide (TPR) repeat protein
VELRERAAKLNQTAVDALRPIVAKHPEATPLLAISLNNLSNRMHALGRREEALAAIEEAVTMRRALAAAQPDTLITDLAAALNNLSNHLARSADARTHSRQVKKRSRCDARSPSRASNLIKLLPARSTA